VLREVGEVDAARSVVEAGYNRQTEARPKQALAELRSLMMKDNSDQIAWLNRADTASPHVRASLASANGFEALLKGNRDEARGHYEAAVAAYDAMPESAATLNNSSLALNAIYSITADPATFKRAADRIDRALALRPSDSILLSNGLSSLMDAVIRDAVGTQIDLAVLGRSADWSMLNFLYHDDAGFEKVYGRVGKHPGLAKSRIYAGKLTLLAPKSTTGYSSLDTIFEITRDESAMARLVEQVRGSGLQDTQREAYLDYLDSKDDAKTKADFEASRARAQAAYDKVKGRKDATFAFAAAALANAMIGGTTFGLPMSADDAVALGQAAQAAAPSVGSQAALEAALLYRAHTKLMASNSAYAAQAKLTQRSFGSHLTRFYLGQTGPIGDAVRAQPDVKTYVKMQIDDLRSLSQRPGAISVYVARAKEPALAKAAEAVLTANRIRPMTDAINGVLSPRDLDTMFRVYFRKLVAGDRPGAHAAVTALVELGVPVPKFE